MEVYIYNSIKRVNSTMHPSDKTNFCKYWQKLSNVVLKSETSLIDPVFEIRTEIVAFNYNYMYVPEFGRGYWIADYAYNAGRWIVSAHVDVLGSFALPNIPQYIVRSSDKFNTNIKDAYIKTTAKNSNNVTSWEWPFAKTIDEGRFIVGIISKQGGACGAVNYYSMDKTQLNMLMYDLMGDIGYMGISASEISQGLQRGIINPIQYIASCMWVPWVPITSATVTSIDCGWWTFNVSAKLISTPQKQIEFFTKTFSVHPQSNFIGKWVNSAPYMDVKLFAPPWGIIDIPLNKINTDNISIDNPPALGIQCFADAISGLATLDVSILNKVNGTWYTQGQIAYATTQLGITIPLAQSSQNAYSAMVSATSSTANSLGFNPTHLGGNPRRGGGGGSNGAGAGRRTVSDGVGVIDRIKGIALNTWSGIKSFFEDTRTIALTSVADTSGASFNPLSVVGSAGSYLNLNRHWELTATYNELIPVDNTNNGKPYCAHDYLGNVPYGTYVEISNPHYVADNGDTPPSVMEIEEYETALAGGVFVENG